MPRSVAAFTSTLSTPTLPRMMPRHRSRQAVDDLLGDADALGIDGVGILGDLDEPVLVGGAFDDLGVDAFQRSISRS